MSSSQDYIEYVMDTLSRVDLEFRHIHMFGEYCIYANDKPIIFVIDDTVCVKKHVGIKELMQGCQEKDIFANSEKNNNKEWLMWVLDIERNDIEEIIYELEKRLPMPKPKKKQRLT